MVQVVRITSPSGQRTLYVREGGVLTHRASERVRTCIVRRLPDHDGRCLVEVDGREERVLVADLSEA
jgi:hypothetical protein